MFDKRSEILKAIENDKTLTYKDCAAIWKCSYGTAYNRININVLFDSNDADIIINYMKKCGIIPKGETCAMLKDTSLEMLSTTTQSISSFAGVILKVTADNKLTRDEKNEAIQAMDNFILTTEQELEVIKNIKKSLVDL